MIIKQRDLAHGLQIVQGAMAKRTPTPALAAVVMEGQGESLKLSATDLELAIETRLAIKDGFDFKALLPRQFIDLVGALPTSTEINLVPGPNKVDIKWPSGGVTMMTIKSEDLPGLPIPEKGIKAVVNSSALHRLLRQSVVAVVEPNPMQQLEGCAFEFNGDHLRLFGTDGFRVAIATTTENEKVVSNSNGGQKFILPLRAVNQLIRLLPEEDKPVEMTAGESAVVFAFNNTRIVSALIGGQYPDVTKVIPRSHVARAIVAAPALAGAIKRVALFSDGDLKPVKITVNGQIIISARSDLGEAQEEVGGMIEGQTKPMTFSSNYFVQGLTAMEAEKVDIIFTGPLTPAQIKPADGKESALYVLLPIRTLEAEKEAAGG